VSDVAVVAEKLQQKVSDIRREYEQGPLAMSTSIMSRKVRIAEAERRDLFCFSLLLSSLMLTTNYVDWVRASREVERKDPEKVTR
jgi:hypothetical protein